MAKYPSVLKIQLILDYQMFYGEKPPEDRISIIRHVSKKHLLFELAGLNYRLKPKDTIYIDQSFEFQRKELEYFTLTRELYKQYSAIAARYTRGRHDYPNIFNRPACLFAIEEITNSDLETNENFQMARVEVWESILKYLLSINYVITQIKQEDGDYKPTVESLNPKLIALNELRVETDPLYTIYKGYRLMEYFSNHPEYAEHLKNYVDKTYSISYRKLIYLITDIYVAKTSNIKEHNFYYDVTGDNTLFEALSKRVTSNDIKKLIGVRKSPFIKVNESKYILADNAMLLEKTYYQFINDFWFDYIKQLKKGENGKELIPIKNYRGAFGYFVEDYLKQLLKNCFINYNHSTLLMFEGLLVDSAAGKIEICDVYLRHGNKVLIGQVKSGSIYDNEKYGGDVDRFYKNDRQEFFKKFGVDQVVASIQNLETHIAIVDPKFPIGHSCKIYPCIIVNDKAFQTPMMNQVFNDRFQELIKDFVSKKIHIYPLTIIHLTYIEKIDYVLIKTPEVIWDYLTEGFRLKKFILPFYNTLNRLLPQRGYPEKIKNMFVDLIMEFNPDRLNS